MSLDRTPRQPQGVASKWWRIEEDRYDDLFIGDNPQFTLACGVVILEPTEWNPQCQRGFAL